MRSFSVVMPAVWRATERVISPIPSAAASWRSANAVEVPRRAPPDSQARVIDDGVPHIATINGLPLRSSAAIPGLSPSQATRATVAQGGIPENVSREAPTEEKKKDKDKEMLSSGEDAP